MNASTADCWYSPTYSVGNKPPCICRYAAVGGGCSPAVADAAAPVPQTDHDSRPATQTGSPAEARRSRPKPRRAEFAHGSPQKPATGHTEAHRPTHSPQGMPSPLMPRRRPCLGWDETRRRDAPQTRYFARCGVLMVLSAESPAKARRKPHRRAEKPRRTGSTDRLRRACPRAKLCARL